MRVETGTLEPEEAADMTDSQRDQKKLRWWHMPISSDDKYDAGRDMMKVVLIWAAVVVALVVVLIVVLST